MFRWASERQRVVAVMLMDAGAGPLRLGTRGIDTTMPCYCGHTIEKHYQDKDTPPGATLPCHVPNCKCKDFGFPEPK